MEHLKIASELVSLSARVFVYRIGKYISNKRKELEKENKMTQEEAKQILNINSLEKEKIEKRYKKLKKKEGSFYLKEMIEEAYKKLKENSN